MPSVQAAQRYASKQGKFEAWPLVLRLWKRFGIIEIDLQYYGKDQEKKNQKTYCSPIIGEPIKAQNKSFNNSSTQNRRLCKKHN